MGVHVQYDIQHDINSVCHCARDTDDIFTNGCSPPTESSARTECTVTHWDHLYTLWAPSGSPVSLHALCKPTNVNVLTEDIITCSHAVVRAASFCGFKERLYFRYKSVVSKIKHLLMEPVAPSAWDWVIWRYRHEAVRHFCFTVRIEVAFLFNICVARPMLQIIEQEVLKSNTVFWEFLLNRSYISKYTHTSAFFTQTAYCSMIRS